METHATANATEPPYACYVRGWLAPPATEESYRALQQWTRANMPVPMPGFVECVAGVLAAHPECGWRVMHLAATFPSPHWRCRAVWHALLQPAAANVVLARLLVAVATLPLAPGCMDDPFLLADYAAAVVCAASWVVTAADALGHVNNLCALVAAQGTDALDWHPLAGVLCVWLSRAECQTAAPAIAAFLLDMQTVVREPFTWAIDLASVFDTRVRHIRPPVYSVHLMKCLADFVLGGAAADAAALMLYQWGPRVRAHAPARALVPALDALPWDKNRSGLACIATVAAWALQRDGVWLMAMLAMEHKLYRRDAAHAAPCAAILAFAAGAESVYAPRGGFDASLPVDRRWRAIFYLAVLCVALDAATIHTLSSVVDAAALHIELHGLTVATNCALALLRLSPHPRHAALLARLAATTQWYAHEIVYAFGAVVRRADVAPPASVCWQTSFLRSWAVSKH